MKFGGTSVGSAERILEVARIIVSERANTEVVVVVSAMSGVTDLLVSAANAAAQKEYVKLQHYLQKLRKIHLDTIHTLARDKAHEQKLTTVILDKLSELHEILTSVYALGELTPRGHDLILSYGERMCIHLVSEAVDRLGGSAQPFEASKLIVTTTEFGDARPLLAESAKMAKPKLLQSISEGHIPVITGFMGATADGIFSTLGRGGSDYSATIIGYCVDATEVWIWTDVDGVMTADPRVIDDAHTISALSYDEAAELSYFGAKVLHPLTIVPASLKDIPIRIKNTFNTEAIGTLISNKVDVTKHAEKAISTTKTLSLITVQGKGMIGVPGVAAKVFGIIASEQINILFISQASSEYNITFAVKQHDRAKAVRALEEGLKTALAIKDLEAITYQDDLVIVAVVGEGMRHHPGVAGKIFSALGRCQANVYAIAQGSSERNISFIIEEKDMPKVLRHLHDEFHLVAKS